MEDVAVYGYITPLKVKIVLALALSDSIVKDLDIVTVSIYPTHIMTQIAKHFMMQIFKAMHMAYFTAISNPFLKLESATESTSDTSPYLLVGSAKWKSFRRRVDEVARVANNPNTLQTV